MSGPIKVSRGGSFELAFGAKHYPKLAVVTPSGHWLVLILDAWHTDLMTEDDFMAKSSIHIDTATLKAEDVVDGKNVVVKVFTDPGKYEFVSADVLETERENMSEVSRVVRYE